MSEKSGGSKLTILIVLLLVAAAVVGVQFYVGDKADKESALINQLKAVRSSVELYVMLNKTYPKDLKILTTEKYVMGNKRSLYLTGISINKEGSPVDSFGNPFIYNPADGKIISGTKGFEGW